MLDGQRCEMSVGYQVAHRADVTKLTSERLPMQRSRLGRPYRFNIEPLLNLSPGLLDSRPMATREQGRVNQHYL